MLIGCLKGKLSDNCLGQANTGFYYKSDYRLAKDRISWSAGSTTACLLVKIIPEDLNLLFTLRDFFKKCIYLN